METAVAFEVEKVCFGDVLVMLIKGEGWSKKNRI